MFDPATAGRFTGSSIGWRRMGEVATVRSGVGVANGLAFSPDGTTMYFADTLLDTVWAFDYDLASGRRVQ